MSVQDVSARLARMGLRLRAEQHALFGAGVSTADGWDVILILYVADAEGRRLTVGDVAARLCGCAEAAKRRIAHLSQIGIIVGDGRGRTDDVVTLSPQAVTTVEDLMERVRALIATV